MFLKITEDSTGLFVYVGYLLIVTMLEIKTWERGILSIIFQISLVSGLIEENWFLCLPFVVSLLQYPHHVLPGRLQCILGREWEFKWQRSLYNYEKSFDFLTLWKLSVDTEVPRWPFENHYPRETVVYVHQET